MNRGRVNNNPGGVGKVMNRPFNGRNFQRNRHQYPHKPKIFIPHVTFDLLQVEASFPRVQPVQVQDEKPFNDALIKRNQELTPSANEQTHLLNLTTRTQTVLDNIILAPGDFDACVIDEIKQVGSFKKGTMLTSARLVADLCVILRTLPTKEAVNQLANKVFSELQKSTPDLPNLHMFLNDRGFEVVLPKNTESPVDASVQVLVTTQQQNIRYLEPELHLDARICQQSLNSIKHVRWYEENASHFTIKVLTRLLKDLKRRFDGLAPMSPWLIELIAHYAVTNTPKRESLALQAAFKRVLQLISAGFLLPGSVGVIDPCEQSITRVHTTMTLEQQDSICLTIQTLLRAMNHGGFKQVLGLEGESTICSAPTTQCPNGVIVTPSICIFEPSKEGNESAMNSFNEKDCNDQDDSMNDSFNPSDTTQEAEF